MTLRVADPGAVEGGLNGRRVLLIFIGFFGVVFAVNGYFLYAALSTHTGVVAVEPYRKGLAYNERIAAAERQAELKWTDAVEFDGSGKVAVRIASADGVAVAGLVVEATLGRPVEGRKDLVLHFLEADGGVYVAAAGRLDEGAWILTLAAMRQAGAEPVFRSRRRLWLKR